MKALSVQQPWASLIAAGIKTIEVRSWPTDHRGELLIVSSRVPELPGLPSGKAVAIVRLVDCRVMTDADEEAARCAPYCGAFAWVLEGAQRVEPFSVRGQLKLFNVEMKRQSTTQQKVARKKAHG